MRNSFFYALINGELKGLGRYDNLIEAQKMAVKLLKTDVVISDFEATDMLKFLQKEERYGRI